MRIAARLHHRRARPVLVRHRRRALVGLAGVLALAAVVALHWLTADLPAPGALITRAASDATKIYDRRGRLLFEVLDPRAGRRTRVALADVAPVLREAVIAVEDAGFYRNPGVEARGIVRAAWQMLRAGRVVSGGSTITQQLARAVLLSDDERGRRSLLRKLRESVLAVRITAAYDKDTILELYLNEVYFGQLAYGVEAASETYFGVHARDLDLAQAALLAGLIQSPAAYNPLVDWNAAKARQDVVLGRLVAEGKATRADADLARSERLSLSAGDASLAAPHFTSYVRALLEQRYGADAVARGGLQVVTTLDLDVQHAAETAVRDQMADLNTRRAGRPDYDAHDAALVAVDPASGDIVAMVGSADYFDAAIDGAVNVALAHRQPGSAIKPITYATAFDTERWGFQPVQGGDDPAHPRLPFTPATVLSDVPTTFRSREGEPYRPQNYDRTWHGPISLRRALATSSNLVAVKVLDAVGVDAMIDTAQALGITTFVDRERYGLALTLGGGEVTLLDLTAAYAGLAARGRRVTPRAILAVLDGPTFAAHPDNADWPGVRDAPAGPQAVPEPVAALITDILSDDLARLPAFGEHSVLELDRPAAAKTGTTTDFRDNWTVGYTPDLAAGVWVGNADNTPMEHTSGITGAGPIWHAFMTAALRGHPARAFPGSPDVVSVTVCESTGLRPTTDCQRPRTERVIRGTEPTADDWSYRAMDIDAVTGARWSADCSGHRVARVFRLLPPDAQAWGREQGILGPPERTCGGRGVVDVVARGSSAGAGRAGLGVADPAV
ncbi:MAG: transglycosylase domain-containing protein, partial [Ardenticatenales bacterium]